MYMKKSIIPILVVFACVIMGIVDAVIQPGYMGKSLIKVTLFLLIPIVYSLFTKDDFISKVMRADRRGFSFALILGVGIYFAILGVYFALRNVFDFSALTSSLNETTGVNEENFLWVALYISFVNSLLEEFFFRGFAFLTLKKSTSKVFAYVFSSAAFSLYHIAMMIGWFGVPVILISLLGLFAGGLIFNKFDDKRENIYLSWLVHMFANFSINTIGLILFAG
ncbi:MAG: CPBP family intramembrane metalloprotease [Ruminococcaceae bacterium]|nr:CPBP family intramembrane metalloprotease [Oscillospiraceae bacterium]